MVKPVNILKKATIEDFKKAYEETGYKPCGGHTLAKGKYACPAAVLYIHKLGIPKGKTLLDKERTICDYYKQTSLEYSSGFYAGVDNKYAFSSLDNTQLQQGYNKGAKVAKALGLISD